MPTGAQMALGDSSVRDFGVLALALLFGIGLIAVIAVWVELRVRRPLRRLSQAVGRAEAGDFLVRAEPSSNGDIGKLSESFNRLLTRITAMQAEEIDTHRDLAAANEQLKLKQAFEATNSQLENRLNELSLLYEVARSFTSTLELPELLGRISALVAERLEIPQFSIMLVNPERKLEVKIAYPSGHGTEGVTFRMDEGACGKAAQTQAAVYIPNVAIDRTTFVARAGSGPERGALLCVPMIHHEEVLGVLNFQRPEKDSFNSEEIELLTAIADQAALAVKNARLHEETVALAITDPLTGIPNRRHLSTRLEMEIARANRFGNQVSILMVDIDHFKSFNDAAGHRAGDSVLRQVADLMKGMIRKVDTIARYGGEEFVLILPQVTKLEAIEVAEKLRRAVEATTFEVGKLANTGRITVSVGVANLPVDAMTQEKLVDCADAALYASKRGGRNQVSSYAAGMELHPGRERSPRTAKRARTG